MSAPLAGKFQDHYAVLGIESTAGSDEVHRAYSQLAQKFHPNNKDTADPEKFAAVNQAYEVLMDPAARQAFDVVRSGGKDEGVFVFSGDEFFQSLENEAARRSCILCLLYDRRRKKPSTPGLSFRLVESLVKASADQLQFSIWCLKQRGYVASDDKSNLLITFQGIEHLEKHLPKLGDVTAMLKPPQPADVRPQASVPAAAPEPAPAGPPPAAPASTPPAATPASSSAPLRSLLSRTGASIQIRPRS